MARLRSPEADLRGVAKPPRGQKKHNRRTRSTVKYTAAAPFLKNRLHNLVYGFLKSYRKYFLKSLWLPYKLP